ncbi:MAG: OmpA family protein [Deltaproteobacteria bacterium]|nr:OmpA family protein [Deltaproteobacteria bacterium]
MKHFHKVLIIIVTASFLAGCCGMKECEKKWQECAIAGAVMGTAIGAIGGYLIGDESDEPGEGAAIGAAAGALIGGGTGYLLCRETDFDGDGVPDSLDACPNTPAQVVVDAKGCPVDTDGDLVPDYLDQCPGTPKNVRVDGKGCCLDSDGDGIADYRDQCPGTPMGTAVDDTGCPLGEKPAPVVLEGIVFDFDSAVIKEGSKRILDMTALKSLQDNPELRIKITGHTDSAGPDEYNRMLSMKRAEAVKEYLVSMGIAGERIETEGMGETSPIASNDTAEGRSKNRRVELTTISQ